MAETQKRFFGRARPQFLGVSDFVDPNMVDPAMAAPVARQGGMRTAAPAEAPMQEAVIADAPPVVDEDVAMGRPSKTKMSIAESLLARGEQPIQQGAGWVGGLDKLAASVGGAYMARKAEEDQYEFERKQGEMLSNALSSGEDDAYSKYISALAKTNPAKAAELNAARLAATDKARIEAKYKTKTRLTRERAENGTSYQEESYDGGDTWSQYGSKPTHAPSSNDPNKPPQGHRWGPPDESGYPTLIPIPGGPYDPATKPDTEIQGKSFAFGTRMAQTIPQLDDPEIITALMSPTNVGWSEWTPEMIGNYRVSSKFRNGMQAVRNFINAQLRKESGAAIGAPEFDNAYRQYIPRPGDDEATLKQKAVNRRVAIYSMFVEAGPKYKKLADRFAPEGLVTSPLVKTPGVRDVTPTGSALPAGPAAAAPAAAPAAPAARPKPKVGDTRPDPRDPKKTRIFDGTNWVIKK